MGWPMEHYLSVMVSDIDELALLGKYALPTTRWNSGLIDSTFSPNYNPTLTLTLLKYPIPNPNPNPQTKTFQKIGELFRLLQT